MHVTPLAILHHRNASAQPRSRGQVAVIFALSIVLFMGLCAIVVDIAFFWVTTLKVQRAADAAALAGAVYLPGDRATAYAEARASATQNDYTGGGGVTVTPVQDAGDPRQLDVTITASSPAFFSRVLGISSFAITRSAKGVYVLPVPMGSPLAYYGVGDFAANQTTTNTNDYTDVSAPAYVANPTSGSWSNPTRGWATGTSNYATSSSNNQVPGVDDAQHPVDPRLVARRDRADLQREGEQGRGRLHGEGRDRVGKQRRQLGQRGPDHGDPHDGQQRLLRARELVLDQRVGQRPHVGER